MSGQRILILVLAVVIAVAAVRMPLTNRLVVVMVRVGLSEDVIVNLVLHHPGRYSVMPDDVARLRHAGVSRRIIAAMIFKVASGTGEPERRPPTQTRAARYLAA